MNIQHFRFRADFRAPLLGKVKIIFDECILGVMLAPNHAAAAVNAACTVRAFATEERIGDGLPFFTRLTEEYADRGWAERIAGADLICDRLQDMISRP